MHALDFIFLERVCSVINMPCIRHTNVRYEENRTGRPILLGIVCAPEGVLMITAAASANEVKWVRGEGVLTSLRSR